jgi:hypothetical protein
VDIMLRGRQPTLQVRATNETGKVTITHELPGAVLESSPAGNIRSSINPFSTWENALEQRNSGSERGRRASMLQNKGWRSSGHMRPLPTQASAESLSQEQQFEQLLNDSLQKTARSGQPYPRLLQGGGMEQNEESVADAERQVGPNGEDLLYVYPYAVSRQQLDQVIRTLNLPVVLTKDIDHADAVLALRSHVKNHSKLRHLAKVRQVPIHTIKASTIPQIARGLRRMLNMDEPGIPDATDLNWFLEDGSDDEMEALEEARLAVEQIVIPKGQPVELLPRSAGVRKLQHELVEHYRLKSRSFGEEPNRRLRIYPA